MRSLLITFMTIACCNAPLAVGAPHIGAGNSRTLAVSAAQRNPSFPDVPAAREAGVPGYDFAGWGGLYAPARTVVMKLIAEIGAALALPDMRKRFSDIGLVTRHGAPEEFGNFPHAQMKRWRWVLAKKA